MVLLSLRLRKKQGPTLPSRFIEAAEDCLLLLVSLLDARLDNRRIRLPFELVGTGVVPATAVLMDTLLALVSKAAVSAIGLVPPTQLRPRELALAFRVKMESGNWKLAEY